jgi:hypothetical protein
MEPTLLNLKISENQPKIAGPPKIVEATAFELVSTHPRDVHFGLSDYTLKWFWMLRSETPRAISPMRAIGAGRFLKGVW